MRECGTCTMCCKLLAIPEFGKKRDLWCPHCAIGQSCTYYTRRPQSCQDFNCLWLQGTGSDDMRPDQTKVVMACSTEGDKLVLYVDTTRPDAWRNDKFKSIIDNLLKKNIQVIVVCGQKRLLLAGGCDRD